VVSYEDRYMDFMDYLFNKPKSISFYVWTVVFILLFIIHVISFYWLSGATFSSGYTGAGWLLGGVLILLGLLFIAIDFIVVSMNQSQNY
jgi:hypothetical protein